MLFTMGLRDAVLPGYLQTSSIALNCLLGRISVAERMDPGHRTDYGKGCSENDVAVQAHQWLGSAMNHGCIIHQVSTPPRLGVDNTSREVEVDDDENPIPHLPIISGLHTHAKGGF
jgi:hypothetical protein